jgi:septal ring factor EnvC (AmiA/AmiB activator)
MSIGEDKVQLELEVLRLRDQNVGRNAEDNERKFRYSLLKAEVEELRKDVRACHKKLKEQHDLLEENMTRAYLAERRLAELQPNHDAAIASLESQLEALRQSRSFRIGRAILSPVRLLRRIFGR